MNKFPILKIEKSQVNCSLDNLDRELNPGDIIAVTRLDGWYQHFGVYVGDGNVVHYALDDNIFKGITIHESSFESFKDNCDDVFRLEFSEKRGMPKQIHLNRNWFGNNEFSYFRVKEDSKKDDAYRLYSPKETVKRARDSIGENNYWLLRNNCEHFAIWCKTNIRESHQVNHVIDMLVMGCVRLKFAFIESVAPVKYKDSTGYLVWDYLIWNEISFVDMKGNVKPLMRMKNDEVTRDAFNQFVKTYGTNI